MAIDMTRNRVSRPPRNIVEGNANPVVTQIDQQTDQQQPISNQNLSNQTDNNHNHPFINRTNIRLASHRVPLEFKDGTKSHPLLILVIGLIIIVAIFTDILGFFSALIAVTIVFAIHHRYEISQRKKHITYINETQFPINIWCSESLRDLGLTQENKQLISEGLRDFFLLRASNPRKPLAMPSKYVDKLWHAFILDTRGYEDYCKKAFGKMLHHVPDYEFADRQNNIKMYTYQSACRLQNIEPASPNNTLPRLFGVDIYVNHTLGIIGAATFATQIESLMHELSQAYQVWHTQALNEVLNAKDSEFDIDIDIDMSGDVSCGSSGGEGGGDSGCGGGCGGD